MMSPISDMLLPLPCICIRCSICHSISALCVPVGDKAKGTGMGDDLISISKDNELEDG